MNELKLSLRKYNPTNEYKIRIKSEVLDNPERFYNRRNLIIKAFEDSTFSFSKEALDKNQFEKKKRKKKSELKEFIDTITKEEAKGIDRAFFKNYFDYQSATTMLKDLVDSDREKNTDLATLIQNNLSVLMNDYYSMKH